MSLPALEAPNNVDAEQALLGAIFINNEAFYRVADFLVADHFYEPVHKLIFDAAAKLIRAGRSASPVTLRDKLPEQFLEDMTIPQYLAMLATEATTVVNAIDYGRSIKDAATRRQLIAIADELRAGAYERSADQSLVNLVEQAEQALYQSRTNETVSRLRGFDAVGREAVEMAAAAYSRDGGLSGLPTGLHDLDQRMGGLQASDLIIIAGRPGMAKTSLATNISFHLASTFLGEVQPDGTVKALKGGRVLFFSLEMSGEQLATRIFSEQTGTPSNLVRRGSIQESQFRDFAEAAARTSQIPLTIEDTGGLSIAQVASTARRVKRRQGLDLIVIDYIQLITGTTRRSGENRVQEVSEITAKLKALAKELNIPIIALSQLSRQVEMRDDKRPQLSDLRDSGSIEQDADVVLFLYRDEYYLRNSEPKEGTPKHVEWQAEMEAAHGKAEIIIGKQRHGPTGTVQVQFTAHLTRFSDLAVKAYLPEMRA